jgi:hypothetical protein
MRKALVAVLMVFGAWSAPASADAAVYTDCAGLATGGRYHCGVDAVVQGAPASAVCLDTAYATQPDGGVPHPYQSGCTVTYGSLWVDYESCSGSSSIGSYAVHDADCRTGTKKASYRCSSHDSTPTLSGPPSISHRKSCVVESAPLDSTCRDDQNLGGMGYEVRNSSCDVSVQLPKANIDAQCVRSDRYGPDADGVWRSTTSETCEAVVTTPVSTTRCTFVPAIGVMYLYLTAVDDGASGSALTPGAGAPTCRRR